MTHDSSLRYICIHGHFYQPPRENPWLEDIEVQDSAHPYHNWNQRITFECYAPNTASRLLDDKKRIVAIVDNYRLISFNFGPTLLSWFERRAPEIHDKIVAADRASAAERGGHGNAMAQAYNHLIMPLASRRDKVTQVRWGIADFKRRFGRDPEGMWLPETAADSETLEILAEHGIKFTVLSPDQARRARPVAGGGDWRDVSAGRVDPSRAYRWTSHGGKTLALFFYDAPISRAVAFEGILNSGETFAGRLTGGLAGDRAHAQLMHIATDGESYGHHHRFGDMALAFALRKIQSEGRAVLTNYGQFLEKHPPEWEAEIVENSSWSCAHGVERWNSDCGCRIGYNAAWNQGWRRPLRAALDNLRDKLDPLFEEKAKPLLKDPWAARDAYVNVVLDRSPSSVESFFRDQQARELSAAERTAALKLLEMQRQRMLMYTSCAWFFDEISGIETVTVLWYAARAVQLAADGTGALESDFLEDLALAPSNVPDLKDGAEVYRRFVRPVVTDLPRVAAHEAIESLFQEDRNGEETSLYCYRVRSLERRRLASGGSALAVGRLKVSSQITGETLETTYAALHMGGHDVHCVLRALPDESRHAEVRETLLGRFSKGSITDVLAALHRTFDQTVYTLHDLFLEERRRILGLLIGAIVGRYDPIYRALVEENRKLIRALKDLNIPIPEALRLALQYVLSQDMEKCLAELSLGDAAADRLPELRAEAERFGLPLDWEKASRTLRHRMKDHLETLRGGFQAAPAKRLLELLDLSEELRIPMNLWRLENTFFELSQGTLKDLAGDDLALASSLAEKLRFPPLAPQETVHK